MKNPRKRLVTGMACLAPLVGGAAKEPNIVVFIPNDMGLIQALAKQR